MAIVTKETITILKRRKFAQLLKEKSEQGRKRLYYDRGFYAGLAKALECLNVGAIDMPVDDFSDEERSIIVLQNQGEINTHTVKSDSQAIPVLTQSVFSLTAILADVISKNHTSYDPLMKTNAQLKELIDALNKENNNDK